MCDLIFKFWIFFFVLIFSTSEDFSTVILFFYSAQVIFYLFIKSHVVSESLRKVQKY